MNDTVVPPARNQTRWVPLVLIMAAAMLFLFLSPAASDLSDWGTDLESAMREASQNSRPILVAFYQPGCAPCKIMDRTVLPDAAVKRLLRDYVPVRLDTTVHAKLALRYGVYGTPTFAVVDSHGRLLSKREGTLSVKEFVQFLSRAANLPSPAPASGHPSLAEAGN